MNRNPYHLTRSIQRILLICLIAGNASGTWGCSGDEGMLATPFTTPIPSVTSVSLTEPTPPSFAQPDATPTLQQAELSFTLRGVWIPSTSIDTQEKADEALLRVQAGNFNAVFLRIFCQGHAYYDSALLEKSPTLEPDYDPLAFVVAQAHRLGLQVHAWFNNGRVGRPYIEPGPILSRHPEWAMVGPDGGAQIYWLNFARSDVRQFMSDVMLEVVNNYDVDGVHFDYIRYPGPSWSFDSYSVDALATKYGVDLGRLQYAQLPAFGNLRGNPLGGVETAEVLAEFDDGTPAVLLNTYGKGQVIVLNWQAERQEIAAASEILRRSLDLLLDGDGHVYILRSETTIARYGAVNFRKGRAWLQSLGWEPKQVIEQDDLSILRANSVLVLPSVYVMEETTANELARFVENGGGLIFIDGPVKAMQYEPLRAITGMQGKAGYFEDERMVLAVGESELIPGGGQPIDLQTRQEIISHWSVFREKSVTALVQDVYQRVKAVRPEVQVSAAVYRRRSSAANVFQNWYAWLAGGYVDFVVPMAYVGAVPSLESLIDEWQTSGDLDRTLAGLKITIPGKDVPKTPEQILAEIELCRQRGIKGIVIFDVEHITDDQLEALATGPFAPQGLSSE